MDEVGTGGGYSRAGMECEIGWRLVMEDEWQRMMPAGRSLARLAVPVHGRVESDGKRWNAQRDGAFEGTMWYQE